jgi:hypothetical protein
MVELKKVYRLTKKCIIKTSQKKNLFFEKVNLPLIQSSTALSTFKVCQLIPSIAYLRGFGHWGK